MNKSEELAILRNTIRKLGPNSYCGPWLASVADEVEREVRGDFFPTPSIAATQQTCDEMLKFARSTAADIEAAARAKAERRLKATEDSIAGIKDRAAIALRTALENLEGRL